jgi:hypothetical protein
MRESGRVPIGRVGVCWTRPRLTGGPGAFPPSPAASGCSAPRFRRSATARPRAASPPPRSASGSPSRSVSRRGGRRAAGGRPGAPVQPSELRRRSTSSRTPRITLDHNGRRQNQRISVPPLSEILAQSLFGSALPRRPQTFPDPRNTPDPHILRSQLSVPRSETFWKRRLDQYWFELQSIDQPLFGILNDEFRSGLVLSGCQNGRSEWRRWRWPSERKHGLVFGTISEIVVTAADAHFAMGPCTQCGEYLVEIKLIGQVHEPLYMRNVRRRISHIRRTQLGLGDHE